jgi:hypothetical protein
LFDPVLDRSGRNSVNLRTPDPSFGFRRDRVPGLYSADERPDANETLFSKLPCNLHACGILWAGAIQNYITITREIVMPRDEFV